MCSEILLCIIVKGGTLAWHFLFFFAYRLLIVDYSSNQSRHNQGRQLVRLGLC